MRRLGGAIVAACVLAAGCSGSGDGDGRAGAGAGADGAALSTPTDLAAFPAEADFYALPDPLPDGEHGTLIRYQPVELAGFDVAGARPYRITYLSESLAGEPIAVTGTVLVPASPAPEGGRPVMTVAHGTKGLADICAPSIWPDQSELVHMSAAVEAGYLVALTDYEGLGTPGRHPYLVGESEGRGVLDAARAAGQLPDAEPSDRLLIFGYSQGGHAALWAGQLAAEWTPELDHVGTVSGAPATGMVEATGKVGEFDPDGFRYMMIAGYHDAYPEEAVLSDVLTPDGEAQLPLVDEVCAWDVLDHFSADDASAVFVPGGLTRGAWGELVERNEPGDVATDAPILVVHSAADEFVPLDRSERLVERMCAAGQVVERRVYEPGASHGDALPVAIADALVWFEQRLAGGAPESTCPDA